MRILLACDQHWPMLSGVAVASRTLAMGLAGRGHEVLVIAPSQTGKSYDEYDENYRVIRTPSLSVPFRDNYRVGVALENQIKGIIRGFAPDVVHIETPAPVGQTVLRAAKKLGIPMVATNHVMPENLIHHFKVLKPIGKPISKVILDYGMMFYKGVDFMIMPTQSAIDLFKKDQLDIPMRPVSNGINLKDFRPGLVSKEIIERYKLPVGKPIVMYLGRLDGEKHVNILIDAFAMIAGNTDGYLLLVGDGAERDNLERQAESLGISDRVIFTGRVPNEDKYILYRAITVFAIPSPAELQCLVLLEAMACGKPAVAVSVGALPELCQDGRNGFLVEVDKPEQMAEKIYALFTDKKLAKKMGDESLKIASKHDINFTLKEIEDIYKSVIEARSKKAKLPKK